jgi:hypothetical protein
LAEAVWVGMERHRVIVGACIGVSTHQLEPTDFLPRRHPRGGAGQKVWGYGEVSQSLRPPRVASEAGATRSSIVIE